jgi:EAL domain-containing protein (putative c-di-GMP-specific phosphodiesterase class I)
VATLHRVLKALDASAFERAVGGWLARTGVASDEALALDGKTLRGIHGDAVPGVHLVGAYAHGAGAILAQVRSEGQGHEVAAAEQLLEAVREHRFSFGRYRLRATASIGVVQFEAGGVTPEELLIDADVAMYAAKEAGRDRVVIGGIDSADHTRARERIAWSQRISEALEAGRFLHHAQPIFNLNHGTVTHYELLLRMSDPGGELIRPAAFLGIAERLSLVQELDRWTLREAIRVLAEHRVDRPLRLTVNVSGRSIGDPQLPALIEEELQRRTVDPTRLILELTETAAIANVDDAFSFAQDVCALGCGFALDDFGAGFGSFYYLKHLPVNFVKIDGDFVRNLRGSSVDQVVVASIVQVANGFGVETIAEDVGDAETLEMLRGFGVDYAQGWHVGGALPLEQALGGGPAPAGEPESAGVESPAALNGGPRELRGRARTPGS